MKSTINLQKLRALAEAAKEQREKYNAAFEANKDTNWRFSNEAASMRDALNEAELDLRDSATDALPALLSALEEARGLLNKILNCDTASLMHSDSEGAILDNRIKAWLSLFEDQPV